MTIQNFWREVTAVHIQPTVHLLGLVDVLSEKSDMYFVDTSTLLRQEANSAFMEKVCPSVSFSMEDTC